jgi:hypothetical protein
VGFFAEVYTTDHLVDRTYGVNVFFDSPVNGLFECALTRASALDASAYISGKNKPNGGYTEFMDFAFWDGVTSTRMTVEMQSYSKQIPVASNRARGRLIIREYDNAAPTSSSSNFHSLKRVLFDSKTGDVVHTEDFYGSADAISDLEKLKADEITMKYTKVLHGSNNKLELMAAPKSFNLTAGHFAKVDLKAKKLVSVPVPKQLVGA